eukprot:476367-Amphidinium_carterae.1
MASKTLLKESPKVWADFRDLFLSKLRFKWKGKTLKLLQALSNVSKFVVVDSRRYPRSLGHRLIE